ncbi:hypothetical protein HDV00_008854, partial [Rhizophlyctis rosea]
MSPLLPAHHPPTLQTLPPELLLSIFLAGPTTPYTFYTRIPLICRRFREVVKSYGAVALLKVRVIDADLYSGGAIGLEDIHEERWRAVLAVIGGVEAAMGRSGGGGRSRMRSSGLVPAMGFDDGNLGPIRRAGVSMLHMRNESLSRAASSESLVSVTEELSRGAGDVMEALRDVSVSFRLLESFERRPGLSMTKGRSVEDGLVVC